MILKKVIAKVTDLFLAFWVAVYIILEELVWEKLAKPIYEYIHRLRILQKVEASISTFNRYTLLVIFVTFFILVELQGIVALKLIAQGSIISGIILYISKIPIAALTFWLFRISKEKLMTFSWFKYLYDLLIQLVEKIKASAIHQNILARIKAMKIWLGNHISKQFISKFWAQIKRLKQSLNI